MPGRSVRIARIAGIPVGISPWWLFVVALMTWSLSAGYFPQSAPDLAPAASAVLALASVLLLFAGILAHEFGHALVARRAGVEIDEIDLWLLGGVARMRNQPKRAGDELRFALAGPAVTAVLALLFGAMAWALSPAAPDPLRAFVSYQAQVNAAILFFNLLPALPLDGGRVARALIWRRTGDLRRATLIAARAGRWMGYGLIYLGALAVLVGFMAGLWTAVIGLFLIAAATAEQRQAELEAALGDLAAGDLMSIPAIVLYADTPIDETRDAIRRHGFTVFPVVDHGGAVVGVLAAARTVGAGLAATAGELADRDAALLIGPDEPAGHLLERAAFLKLGRAVVVDADRRPLGVVSVTDMERRLRGRRTAGARSQPKGATQLRG
jgi:Zn-dependent protease/predicted transcriptional regulator